MSNSENEICTNVPFRIGSISSLVEFCRLALMGTTLECLGMPDPRLMCGPEVQSKWQEFQAVDAPALTLTFELLFFGSRAMDVIGTAAKLYRK